ncbi:uncharacterized protein LOC132860386 [Tachysurus vachellii]|uniref:uncharacterized protein LOC132860386 n=1 Tax=Tachysurus vachellii TaxID=175792 RepID=UPI00296A9D0A|nr:uncharacterized protein LOC132860386 [Tachysurus vachellii]
MIRLFVALCALFSLFTAVKTSDIKEIDVITVKLEEDVTMKCSISSVTKKDNVVWYRQSSGKLPQYFAKPYKNDLGYKFVEGFNDDRFSISVNDSKFDLSIKKTIEVDEGEYFCGEMEGSVLKLTSGTRLQFEGKQLKNKCFKASVFFHTGCCFQIQVMSYLSMFRVGVLVFLVIIFTIFFFYNGLSFGSMDGLQKCDLSRPSVLLELGCQVNQETYWWTRGSSG